MSEQNSESQQAASLRERAEKAFREMPGGPLEDIDSLSPEALRASRHELRAHQIELEMQNMEMVREREALADLQARYFDLYDLAPVSYCTIGERGLILEANLTASTLLRVKRGALVGRLLTAFISNEDQTPYYLCWKNLLDTREPQECDVRMFRHDGTAFFAHLNFTVARDKNGAPVCLVALSDITSRKQAEEALLIALELEERVKNRTEELRRSESRFRELFEHSPVAYQSLDDSGRFLDVNDELCALLGYGRDELIGKPFSDFWSPDTSDRFPATFERFKCNGATSGELSLVRGDGTPLTVLLEGRIQHGSDGGFIRAHCVLYNITERKNRERELELARDVAKSATQSKSEFLAIMSHEIRNPLNGILGFAELLAGTPLTGEQQSCTEAIEESGAHLLSLINDVLDFSSIEKGALAIHAAPFDLAHLVKLSSDIVRKSATDKGLAIHCDVVAGVPKKITGDERRIRQILINLLANAVKFTSDGSVSLRVTRSGKGAWASRPCEAPVSKQEGSPFSLEEGRVEPAASGGEFLEFSVEDTGLGISSEALARLFKLFTQADTTINQKYGGTGIGLAVSGRLAEAMGGTISVVSDPGKGTTFTFRLPLEVPAGGTASVPPHLFIGADGASPSSPGALTPVRIDALPVLVADDDRSHSLMVGKVLQSLGYRVEFAANGAEAVDAFAPGKYLAILMDLQMPVMNGFEAAAIIRSRESSSRVPIIALTGNVIASSPEAYFAAGMDDFLSKPFKKEELAAKLACVAQIEGAAEGAPA